MNQISLLEVISKMKFSDFISLFALLISGISIFWNIYRDLILKAKIRTHVQISSIIQPGRDLGSFIDVTGVNHGPGRITCESVFIKASIWQRLKGSKKYGFIMTDHTNPLSGKLPKRLEVGEKITVLFPHVKDAFLARKPARVGLKDSFGRLHWATRKNINRAIKDYFRDFPEKGGETD